MRLTGRYRSAPPCLEARLYGAYITLRLGAQHVRQGLTDNTSTTTVIEALRDRGFFMGYIRYP